MGKFKKILALGKLLLAWVILNVFRRDLYKKDLWLVREKGTEARDNGYHFFRYVRENHPECPVYYAITRDSADRKKLEPYGNLIELNSWKHYLYWLAAETSINSQARGAVPYPDGFLFRFRRFCRRDQKLVFLRHGIVKDEMPHDLDYSRSGYDLICSGAERERKFIQETYHYPEGIVKFLGLCRFDRLTRNKNKTQKQILVMPTFRKWLVANKVTEEATEREKESFLTSDYFKQYAALLTDERLIRALAERQYTLVFYPHYSLQSYVSCFQSLGNERVMIADRKHYDVQQLLMESRVLVTDFSSIFFDFAYMEKPEVFFQFDEERYRAGHYKQGYFDYRTDGFGPVFTEKDEVVDGLLHLIERDGRIEEPYLERIRAFFTLRDDWNCERTYLAVKALGAGKKPNKKEYPV